MYKCIQGVLIFPSRVTAALILSPNDKSCLPPKADQAFPFHQDNCRKPLLLGDGLISVVHTRNYIFTTDLGKSNKFN